MIERAIDDDDRLEIIVGFANGAILSCIDDDTPSNCSNMLRYDDESIDVGDSFKRLDADVDRR
jgi:hypothetical protein